MVTTRTIRRALACAIAAALVAAAAASAQEKRLTLDDIYGPTQRDFTGAVPSGLVWSDAAHVVWPRHATGGVDWVRLTIATGATQPLFDPAAMQAALERLPGISADDARHAAHDRDLVFDRAFGSAIATIADDLYLYSFADSRAARLTFGRGTEEQVSFSPDGSTVAFVRDHNLFVVDVATRRETALTTDGEPAVLNGRLDWVYEEEIYGRGHTRGYWWSPDSSRLAFLRIDDRPVSTYLTIDDIPYSPKVETWRYPRAGDPNPIAKLGVVRSAGGPITWIDTSKYSNADHLIVRVGWMPDSRNVVYEVENRTQSWLDLNAHEVPTNRDRTIFRETSRYWISSEDAETPTWLKDGSFLWLSDRTGWTHIYHYAGDGTLLKQVTDGKWEVRALHGVDERAGIVYFSGTERSPIGVDVYRVSLDGSGFARLSQAAGTHDADFDPSMTHYVDTWSDVTTPPQVSLHRSDGAEVRAIGDRRPTALADYKLSTPEFLQVPARDGFVMEAMMIKPPDFDPSRRYPVYQFAYGGPHTPQVKNAWGGAQYLYHQLLAQHGIIVWICDNRTASGKGDVSTWPLFHRFGETELGDIEDGLKWVIGQGYADPARIGLHGWSYGGFMTVYALTHSTMFAMGIAGGTVADWRDYDSVYTERYLGMPQDNPQGYRDSSPRWSVENLHGALLLIHGEVDDNVHPQNTMQLAYALQQADKPFQLMLYPKSRHGISDPALIRHLRGTMLDFTLEHLRPQTP